MTMTVHRQSLVTVIVPTIGRPRYIADTVRSLLAQDHRHLDILISDNAPSASTSDLLIREGVTDPRIRFVVRARRMGFSEHMNACIAEAAGELLMILSDDDQLTPSYVSEMVGFMADDPRVAACLGRQTQISEQQDGLIVPQPPTDSAQVIDGAAFLKGVLSGALKTGVLTNISLFARKKDVDEAGAFKTYPDGSHADNFLLLALALRGSVAIGASRMFYRVYSSSFGLSTPFPALLEATRLYTIDSANALAGSAALSRRDQSILTRLVKRNNAHMLISRARSVYWRRLSSPASVVCLLRAFRFAATPVRLL